MSNNKIKFTVESQYQFYLEKIGIAEDQMGDLQKIEMRRAFMGGFGQCIILMVSKIAALPEKEAENIVIDFFEEVQNFWHNQDKMQNQHLTKH